MENKFKYNFVFFFARDDYWKSILGKELYNHQNVRVYKLAFNSNKLLKFLFRIHWSYKINSKINLPFKRIWFKKMYKQSFNNNLPICFVYLGANNIRFDGGFTKYVKRLSSDNRQVVYNSDLISKKCRYDYKVIKDKTDLSITYDKGESEKYKIHHFPETVYSKLIEEPKETSFEQDVYFLGAAKDRLPKILEVHKVLVSKNIKCKFLIAGVPEDKQMAGDGITYITSVSYKENLENVIKSKCILEIIQDGSTDITLRTREAMAYRRKLLTNCVLCNENYFNKGQLQIFAKPEHIDIDFIKEELIPDNFTPVVDMNPLNRLFDIQNALEEQDE